MYASMTCRLKKGQSMRVALQQKDPGFLVNLRDPCELKLSCGHGDIPSSAPNRSPYDERLIRRTLNK